MTVASFDFAESEILAELYATSLEAHGFPVERALGLGSRELLQPALVQHKIDFVPEYLGTALGFLTLGAVDVTSHASSMHRALKRTLASKGVDTLAYAAAQDKNGLVVTRSTAQEYDLKTTSDLVPFASNLVFGGPPECDERPQCLPGFAETYGLHFKRFEPLDVGGPATLAALIGGEIDVALLFTTDPNLDSSDLVLLADDKDLQPADNVVPVVASSVTDRFGPAFTDAVNAVSRVLTTGELRSLNREVLQEHRDVHDAAESWLEERGLV